MRPFKELEPRIMSLAGDIFGNNHESYDHKSWLRHPKFVTCLDLCLICTEIEEVLIICPTRFTSGTDLKVSFYMNGEFYPKVQGEPVERIFIHTHRDYSQADFTFFERTLYRFEQDHDENIFFASLVGDALSRLRRMKDKYPEKKIVQACGPISTGPGSVEDKLIRFNKMIYNLERDGMYVFDEMPYEPLFGVYHDWIQKQSGKHSNEGILNLFYKPIIESGLIDVGCFSNDYDISEGARWEFEKMRGLGIETRVLPENFITDFWEERIPGIDMLAHYEYLLQKDNIKYTRDKFEITSSYTNTYGIGMKSRLFFSISQTGFMTSCFIADLIGEKLNCENPEKAIEEFKLRLSVFKLESKSST